jgi:hypothetical protein
LILDFGTIHELYPGAANIPKVSWAEERTPLSPHLRRILDRFSITSMRRAHIPALGGRKKFEHDLPQNHQRFPKTAADGQDCQFTRVRT